MSQPTVVTSRQAVFLHKWFPYMYICACMYVRTYVCSYVLCMCVYVYDCTCLCVL